MIPKADRNFILL